MTSNRGWKTVKFGDIAENVAVRIDPAQARTDVYVGLEHLDPETIHLKQWGHPSDVSGQKLVFQKEDVVFGRRRAYQRKLAVADRDGICSAHAMVLRAKPKMVLPEFLPFFLQSDMFMERAIGISVGSLSPTINWKTLKIQQFPLPPLAEQKRIAEILWAADEAVESWNRTINGIDFLASVYRMCVFSQKRWPRQRMKGVFSFQLGKMLSPKAKKGKSPYPYLANFNIQWDKIDIQKIQQMDFTDNERRKYSLVKGDVLVCEGGEVGRSAIWNGEIEDCYFQKALHRLRPLSQYSSELLLQYMMWANRKGIFKALTGHSTIAHLTAIKLKELKIPVPPLEDQMRLERAFLQMKNAKVNTNRSLDHAQVLKTTLVNELIV